MHKNGWVLLSDYQAVEAERDAARAEVELTRKAIDAVAKEFRHWAHVAGMLPDAEDRANEISNANVAAELVERVLDAIDGSFGEQAPSVDSSTEAELMAEGYRETAQLDEEIAEQGWSEEERVDSSTEAEILTGKSNEEVDGGPGTRLQNPADREHDPLGQGDSGEHSASGSSQTMVPQVLGGPDRRTGIRPRCSEGPLDSSTDTEGPNNRAGTPIQAWRPDTDAPSQTCGEELATLRAGVEAEIALQKRFAKHEHEMAEQWAREEIQEEQDEA